MHAFCVLFGPPGHGVERRRVTASRPHSLAAQSLVHEDLGASDRVLGEYEEANVGGGEWFVSGLVASLGQDVFWVGDEREDACCACTPDACVDVAE